MNNNKKTILESIIINAEVGIAFLDQYSCHYVDLAYSRFYCITFSYVFELSIL